MKRHIPEPRKKPGVAYVFSDDGVELPVIDLTHPAFDVGGLEAQLPALIASFLDQSRRRERLPKFINKFVLRVFLRGSVLGGSLQSASGSFLSGMSTYLFKIGPDNLGTYAKPVDQLIAASLPSASMRLRLWDMARMLSEGMARALKSDTQRRPVLLLNVGGGPCMDGLNALLLLRRDHPELLRDRRIRIAALDVNEAGPSFGARALEALRAAGGPLEGVDAELRPVRYDWSRPAELASLLEPLREPNAFVAASSEGALFEYADDVLVDGNLRALRSVMPPDGFVTGSVTSDSETSTLMQKTNPVALHPRSEQAFRDLAARSGWQLREVVERPLTHDCLLVVA